jgi:hypothetical protein
MATKKTTTKKTVKKISKGSAAALKAWETRRKNAKKK